MAYCAPEVYTGERFTVKSDVYSLGIITITIINGIFINLLMLLLRNHFMGDSGTMCT